MDENQNNVTPRRLFSFTIRELLLLTVIVALALAVAYSKRSSGEGRYQFVSTGPYDRNYILDTVTGQVWTQTTPDGNWTKQSKQPPVGK